MKIKFKDATNGAECLSVAEISYFSRMKNGCLVFKRTGSDVRLTSYIGVSDESYLEYTQKLWDEGQLDLSSIMFSEDRY